MNSQHKYITIFKNHISLHDTYRKLRKSNLSIFPSCLSGTMQRLGPLIFGSNGDVQFLKDKCFLSSDRHCPRCFEEMRIDQFTFVLFVCIYQCECKSWGADSSIGQKSSCEEYAPHTAKCILGAYSSQYPHHQYNTRSRLMF